MKVVIDSNIFVSSMWGGNPEAVVDRVIEGFDELFITDTIIDELEKTLNKPELKKTKYNITQDRIDDMLHDIKIISQKVVISPHHKATGTSRDKDDDKFIECAVAANADCIITGDKDLLVLKKHNGIRIITAKEYLEIVNRYNSKTYRTHSR